MTEKTPYEYKEIFVLLGEDLDKQDHSAYRDLRLAGRIFHANRS